MCNPKDKLVHMIRTIFSDGSGVAKPVPTRALAQVMLGNSNHSRIVGL